MQIQQSATFSKTISILDVLAGQGAKYCLRMPDGTTYGNMEIPAETRKKKVFSKLRQHGAVANYLHPFLANMQVGDVAQIPIPNLPDMSSNKLQSTICARCHKLWGVGTYTTLKVDNGIEVMRTK